jgi:threonine synthase
MNFYSTGNKQLHVDFEHAVRVGLAPDGGLFMPDQIDPLPISFWEDIDSKSFNELSLAVATHFLTDSLPHDDVKRIIDSAINFDAPLVRLESSVFALELFHGPTLAFKDFGARFLAGVLGHFASKRNREATILVATSGDTGSAVAHGFYKVAGTRVIVLYPSGKVSDLQEKQFATLGENITVLEVSGTFDDCQRLVKLAFADNELNKRGMLTSANSINIARLLPQMFYYFRAWQCLPAELRNDVIVSVPSGNFGNLTAGLMAKKMGLPVKKFVAATNANDVVPAYLKTSDFMPGPSIATISNAMDVGNPSNFTRLTDMHSFSELSDIVEGFSFTDQETVDVMQKVHSESGYIMDPHGAVAYLGLRRCLRNHSHSTGIFLETAHPGKFKEVVETALGEQINLPEKLARFASRKKMTTILPNNFPDLKDFLISTLAH